MTNREDVVASFQDEVNELHPVLEKLLTKIPGVTDVEYTHGTSEMGADFVLAKRHESLGHLQYVAVVAKIGKLTQNFDGIERQIGECFDVPRFFRNGKENISISEVWVVVTQNVTGGAQHKIRARYSSRNVEFIDGRRLTELINSHLPIFWVDLPLQIADYLSTLRQNVIEEDKRLALIETVQDHLFIEPDIYEAPRIDYLQRHQSKIPKRRKVNIYKEIEQERFLLIEGGMGAGKSKLLRELVQYYTNPETYKLAKLLPVHCTYRELVDNFEGSIDALLKGRIASHQIAEFSKSNLLVLIDGLDEKKLSAEAQLQALDSLERQVASSANIRAVVTSRYLPMLPEATHLKRRVAAYELMPLTLAQTIEFVRLLCSRLDIKDRIAEDLKKSPLFRELPQSPIAAILLAKLLNENSDELPSNLTELYSKYSELTLGRWDMRKGLQSEKEYEALDNIVMLLADFVIRHELDSVSISEAKTIVHNYLSQRNLGINEEEIFDRLARRSEMIAVNNHTSTLSFRHRTFAEFFFAKARLRRHDFEINNRVFQPYWLHTYFFYLGLQKDCPELLEQITKLDLHSYGERWIKVINMGNYLLAGYASPYQTIAESLKIVMLEAAQLYLDTLYLDEDSPFVHFTQMQLLWLMQMLVRSNYSYEFFRDALESSAFAIAEHDFDVAAYDSEIAAYALFLLNVTYIELKVTESFDFLLRNYTEVLPLDLSYAVRHEARKFSERTKLMRQQDRRIRKLLKNNNSANAAVDKMFGTPIRASRNRR